MTKEEIFEMFDRYDAYETLDTGETVQVIHWHDLKHIAEEIVKNCSIPDVVKSLPNDECVEQWWAEGQDQNKGFWQEAPYRTNGDVIEEIKAALKYFIETWQR